MVNHLIWQGQRIEVPSQWYTLMESITVISDNVECGTTAVNYYSKLHRVTSNAFPHLVPDRYRELLRPSCVWRHLKLLKWKGFCAGSCEPGLSDLVLFFPTCPQLRINIPDPHNIDMSENTKNEFWLMDGHGYMMGLQSMAYDIPMAYYSCRAKRSDCSNHHVVNQANASRGHLASTGIGGCACARHGCFIPHAMVDFQKGEQQINMDYALIHAVQYQMQPTQQVIHFYDINCQYGQNLHRWIDTNPLISILQVIHIQPGIGIWHVHGHCTECFTRYTLNFIPRVGNVDGEIMETLWSSLNIVSPSTCKMMNDSNFLKMIRMCKGALWTRMHDPKMMDIFDVQLCKAPEIKSVEMNLIEAQIALKIDVHGIHLWATENQQLTISWRRDKLKSHVNGFLEYAGNFIGQGWNGVIVSTLGNESEDFDEVFTEIYLLDPEAAGLPLPSYLGLDMYQDLGLEANNALHELCLALADKSCLFHMDVRHSHNYNMTSCAWKKASDADAVVRRHTAYQLLEPHHLWVSTVVMDPNAHRHQNEYLTWFWTMDIPKDTNTNDWMSEFYQVHWLWEVELLTCELQWTQHFFESKAKFWKDLESQANLSSHCRFCCYVAQQGKLFTLQLAL
ncbi:hypothetical protein V8B97DRAFT_2026252 [Scleroderma yunnanense]